MMKKRAFVAVLRAVKSSQPAAIDVFKDGSWFLIRCWQRFGASRDAVVLDVSRHRKMEVAFGAVMTYDRWISEFEKEQDS